ncbi:amidase [Halobacillus salinarum]|uniref:Amidase n=1 Tax=Halobacillus salinarum TaxID=2932257 RepID=A0ABY4EHS9_9BACI|nr:amidase [Halobacillus salinarum]UOQ43699.1 amidase [Halobacillus salinarum]
MSDQYQGFINEELRLVNKGGGELSGRTFSVKDVFAVKGHSNAAGNPTWLETHKPAVSNAPVIDRLLLRGAELTGITHTDELMYSLNGENVHFGTPINPKAPARIPGGSSSGSAVTVAGNEVDFALGTDTGGSVRIPSSYCGLFGFRPSHGAIDMTGVIPLAPSFDTVGWMAGKVQDLYKVGKVILKSSEKKRTFSRIILGEDAWELLDVQTNNAFSEVLEHLHTIHGHLETVRLSSKGLDSWFHTFKHIQGWEIWQQHGAWIEEERPVFGPDIEERFQWARTVTEDVLADAFSHRRSITGMLKELLGEDGLLVIPTAPGGPPKRNTPGHLLQNVRGRTMQLSCIAGLAGLPQVTLPLVEVQGLPVGLSVIANEQEDENLLEWVYQTMPEISPVVTETS